MKFLKLLIIIPFFKSAASGPISVSNGMHKVQREPRWFLDWNWGSTISHGPGRNGAPLLVDTRFGNHNIILPL